MKIVFMGTSAFSLGVLEGIYEKHDILAVFTQEDRRRGRGKKLHPPEVKVFAMEKEIPVHQVLPSVELLENYDADLLVVAAYGRLLSEEVLDFYPKGAVNVHTSLLPKYRGASPIQTALLHGEKETGVCIMKMTLGMDEGDVYSSARVPTDDLRYGELEERLMEVSVPLLLDTLDKIQEGSIEATPQDEEKASYCKKIQKQDTEIDWNKSAKEIEGAVRAYWPSPMAFTYRKGERLLLHRVHATELPATKSPGTVEKIEKEGMYVASGDHLVLITELQRPGRNALATADYLRGNPTHEDEKLGG